MYKCTLQYNVNAICAQYNTNKNKITVSYIIHFVYTCIIYMSVYMYAQKRGNVQGLNKKK